MTALVNTDRARQATKSTVLTDTPGHAFVGRVVSEALRDTTLGQKSEFLVQGRDGKIRLRDFYEDGPRPAKS